MPRAISMHEIPDRPSFDLVALDGYQLFLIALTSGEGSPTLEIAAQFLCEEIRYRCDVSPSRLALAYLSVFPINVPLNFNYARFHDIDSRDDELITNMRRVRELQSQVFEDLKKRFAKFVLLYEIMGEDCTARLLTWKREFVLHSDFIDHLFRLQDLREMQRFLTLEPSAPLARLLREYFRSLRTGFTKDVRIPSFRYLIAALSCLNQAQNSVLLERLNETLGQYRQVDGVYLNAEDLFFLVLMADQHRFLEAYLGDFRPMTGTVPADYDRRVYCALDERFLSFEFPGMTALLAQPWLGRLLTPINMQDVSTLLIEQYADLYRINFDHIFSTEEDDLVGVADGSFCAMRREKVARFGTVATVDGSTPVRSDAAIVMQRIAFREMNSEDRRYVIDAQLTECGFESLSGSYLSTYYAPIRHQYVTRLNHVLLGVAGIEPSSRFLGVLALEWVDEDYLAGWQPVIASFDTPFEQRDLLTVFKQILLIQGLARLAMCDLQKLCQYLIFSDNEERLSTAYGALLCLTTLFPRALTLFFNRRINQQQLLEQAIHQFDDGLIFYNHLYISTALGGGLGSG